MTHLPTRNECLLMLEEHNVPENVRKHSLCVNKVAVFLASRMKEKGISIDVDLVDRASLLHDLDKIKTLHTGDHGLVAYDILRQKGYSEVARVVKNHLYDALDSDLEWEEKIVNYADKRCSEDKIVPLQERMDYIMKHYSSKYPAVNKESEEKLIQLEKEIFSIIGIKPEDMEGHMR